MDVPHPSDVVLNEVGTPSVGEAAALLAAGPDAELVVEKQKGPTATVSIARRVRPPGEVLVVDPASPVDWIRTTAGIIANTGSDSDPSRTRFRGRHVSIKTGHVRKRQIDGDLVTAGAGLDVAVLPGALVVRTPSG